MKSLVLTAFLVLGFSFLDGIYFHSTGLAQPASQTINLPNPVKTGGLPLNEALNLRRSERSVLGTPLPQTQISQILWTAFGVNREAGSMRTIPTAHNRQDLLVYAVLDNGVWLYDAPNNKLELQLKGDHTDKYGQAPLTLLYAVPEKDGAVGGVHVGAALQGVGLLCASEKLANVVKLTGADALKGQLPLPTGYHVVVVQSVGLPADEQ
ncbi:MAG: nitroreductase family protein [Deltaproteobacteria bacterium]|nr:nitroreductase family protein [Deltaproteobacteria bacterium]